MLASLATSFLLALALLEPFRFEYSSLTDKKGNVSFGKMFVKRSDADPKLAALVDAEIEKDYQENL